MWQHNWFKKENFKTELTKIRATNKLEQKRLERQLGLERSKEPPIPSPSSTLDKLGQAAKFLPLLKDLEPEQLTAIIDHFIGGGFGEETETGEGGIIGFAEEHPDIVKSFIDGLSSEAPAESEPAAKVANY